VVEILRLAPAVWAGQTTATDAERKSRWCKIQDIWTDSQHVIIQFITRWGAGQGAGE